MARLFLSAAHKSSGKTTVTVGIAAALRTRGLVVQPFKKGPDYIDPMWLATAAGRSCRNLDFHTMTREEIRAEFARHGAGADLAIVEGNKGLHDGVAVDGADSNAALAKLLEAPVVLVVDTRGITRGIAPLLRGYRDFDRRVRIVGVILNQVAGARHEGKLVQAVCTYTDMPVLGAVGRSPDLALDAEHIGLVPPAEMAKAEARVARIARRIEECVDLDRVQALASR
ncbi:MAG: AAA family ATPase, partial [Thiotrichales bacterium]|nr:AAA family ATPase [Thiotrichales bacterium]